LARLDLEVVCRSQEVGVGQQQQEELEMMQHLQHFSRRCQLWKMVKVQSYQMMFCQL
jgi:hypothetical protein